MSVDLGFGPGLQRYFDEIQEAGIYGNFGPQVEKLENQFSDYFGVESDRIVTSSNATIALLGAMEILEISQWLIPSWTFAATAHAAVHTRSSIFFGDVQSDNWVLEPNNLSGQEGAVITAPFGSSISIGAEWNTASALVIDAAAAIGAPPVLSPSFTKPWVQVFSLHATKLMGIGEGAVVLFSDSTLASAFRMWSNFGFYGSRQSQSIGMNGKLSEPLAAIARFRLENWDAERLQWSAARERVHYQSEKLGLNPVFSHPGWLSPYWIVDLGSRDRKLKVASKLAENGVETRDWWSSGCHTMPAFRNLPTRGNLSVTDQVSGQTLGLPFFKEIEDSVVEMICGLLADALHGS
jgi:dTDP-4-amino-4,6-dideoxygalactose transaminase